MKQGLIALVLGAASALTLVACKRPSPPAGGGSGALPSGAVPVTAAPTSIGRETTVFCSGRATQTRAWAPS